MSGEIKSNNINYLANKNTNNKQDPLPGANNFDGFNREILHI